jgi:chromosomal replication initiation ATPase DnaA
MRKWKEGCDMGPVAKKAAREIAARYGVTFDGMMGDSQIEELRRARRAFYVYLYNNGVSYPKIAEWMGKRNEAVVRAVQRYQPQAASSLPSEE